MEYFMTHMNIVFSSSSFIVILEANIKNFLLYCPIKFLLMLHFF